MGLIDWTGVLGAIAVLLMIFVRASLGIKDLMSSIQNTVHDDVKVPVNHLSDKVDGLNNRLDRITRREDEDHHKVMGIMRKLNHDNHCINKHDRLIKEHEIRIDQHDKDIKEIKKKTK